MLDKKELFYPPPPLLTASFLSVQFADNPLQFAANPPSQFAANPPTSSLLTLLVEGCPPHRAGCASPPATFPSPATEGWGKLGGYRTVSHGSPLTPSRLPPQG